MPISHVIDALRRLAPECQGGSILLDAADVLDRLRESMQPMTPYLSSEWLLPPPDPQR